MVFAVRLNSFPEITADGGVKLAWRLLMPLERRRRIAMHQHADWKATIIRVAHCLAMKPLSITFYNRQIISR